jgi:hypothetical protein
VSNRLAKKLLMEQRGRELGHFGKPTPKREPLESEGAPRECPIDTDIDRFLCPSVDDQLGRPGSSLTGFSIMEEVSSCWPRTSMKGEPIGAYKKRDVPKPATLKVAREYYCKRGRWKQEELMALRHKNDLAMGLIIRKGK